MKKYGVLYYERRMRWFTAALWHWRRERLEKRGDARALGRFMRRPRPVSVTHWGEA